MGSASCLTTWGRHQCSHFMDDESEVWTGVTCPMRRPRIPLSVTKQSSYLLSRHVLNPGLVSFDTSDYSWFLQGIRGDCCYMEWTYRRPLVQIVCNSVTQIKSIQKKEESRVIVLSWQELWGRKHSNCTDRWLQCFWNSTLVLSDRIECRGDNMSNFLMMGLADKERPSNGGRQGIWRDQNKVGCHSDGLDCEPLKFWWNSSIPWTQANLRHFSLLNKRPIEVHYFIHYWWWVL